jgi:trk system potassium uptake protein
VRAPRIGPALNWQVILPVVGFAMLAVAVGMGACAIVGLAEGDGPADAFGFGLPSLLAAAGGLVAVLTAMRLPTQPLRPRDGFLAVTLAWLAAAVLGTVPFLAYGTFGDAPLVHAFFESMSGITTTGATLIDDVDGQPAAILLWRSVSQWLGGVGIVVLVIAIAPATGLANTRVFDAETTGVTTERLTPRIADTAKIIFGIYLTLTAAALVAYLAAGMGAWDALNHGFTSVATGGFSTKTASIAHFDSLAVELVAIVAMAASAVNFAFYWRAIRGRSIWPQFEEVRAYLLLLAAGIAIVTTSLLVSGDGPGGWTALRHAAFAATTLMTGTGYTTVDYDEWNDLARSYLMLAMFLGGCAGSTAGGVKIIRVLLLARTAQQEIARQLRPSAVQVLRIRGRIYSEELRRGVLAFASIYTLVSVAATIVMTAWGLDLVSAIGSVAATINVVGPGFGIVGGTESYASVPEGGLWSLSALMLIGRLEIFTVLVLLTPAFWRRNVA